MRATNTKTVKVGDEIPDIEKILNTIGTSYYGPNNYLIEILGPTGTLSQSSERKNPIVSIQYFPKNVKKSKKINEPHNKLLITYSSNIEYNLIKSVLECELNSDQ